MQPIFILLLASTLLTACGSSSGSNRSSGNHHDVKNSSKPSLQTSSPKAVTIDAISLIARHATGEFDKSAAEIVDYHKASKRAFVINAQARKINVLNLSNLPSKGITGDNAFSLNNLKSERSIEIDEKIKPLNASEFEVGAINSLSIVGNLMAVAVENKQPQSNGAILFYRLDSQANASKLHALSAGAMPDMVKITADGKFALSANEGEPNKNYDNDPEGSITLVRINNGMPDNTSINLDFNHVAIPTDVIIKQGITKKSKDLEPEYIAIADDSSKAWISLQENNALAIIDLTQSNPKIDKVVSLGFKDYRVNQLDAINNDKQAKLQNHAGLYGMYMPDTLVSYSLNGEHYVLSANEGDGREYGKYENETKVGKLKKPLASTIASLKKTLSELKVHNEMGLDNTGTYTKLYTFGARSFSIWNAQGTQLYDSGSVIENEILKATPAFLNTNSNKLKLDDRSDNKGPEPEAIAVGQIGGSYFAFVGLERQGGFMVFDISNPQAVKFIRYINNRNFTAASVDKKGNYKEPSKAGDLAPESIKFIAAKDSAIGVPLLLVANEVSGSTSVYKIISH